MTQHAVAVDRGHATGPATKALALPIHRAAACSCGSTRHATDQFDLKPPASLGRRIPKPAHGARAARMATG